MTILKFISDNMQNIKKIRLPTLLPQFILVFISILPSFSQEAAKPRIIVTTDITNEPDDQESLIRLLVYANDFDIEGLIGSTGVGKCVNQPLM
jgi:hypothetical protein